MENTIGMYAQRLPGDLTTMKFEFKTTVTTGDDNAFVRLGTLTLPSTTLTLTTTVSPGAKSGDILT